MFNIPADREKLERAVQAIKSGNTARGNQLLNEVLLENPRNVLAILWLTKCTDDPRQQAVLYQHALNIEPDNPHALKGVKLFSQYLSPAASTPAPKPHKLSRARREIAASREQEPQAKPSAPQFQPEPPPPIEQPSAPQFQPDAPPRTDSGKNLLNVAIGVAAALLLIVLALMIAPSLSGPPKVSREAATAFREAATAFLLEAGKLDAMTSQGVTRTDFANQLAQVKSSYQVLSGQSSTTLATSKESFDEAIDGWSLTLTLWDWGLEQGGYLSLYYPGYTGTERAMTNAIQQYLGATDVHMEVTHAEGLLQELLAVASSHFEGGRTLLQSSMQ